MKIRHIILPALLGITVAYNAYAEGESPKAVNVAEEVAWVVGDQAIWRSDIEEAYQQMLMDKADIPGDPYCFIPEQLALEKLYLHQADLDTVEVTASMVQQQVDARINYFIANIGSKEKVEEYFHRSMPQMREAMTEMITNQYRVQQVQENLTKDVKVTPSDVRRYFEHLPQADIPAVPEQVEVQILTINPVIPRQEIEDVKSRLRDFADRVNSGESDFSTLAILYSEDEGSRSRGGEIGFMGKAHLDPEYAAVAFNLNDPKKVSKIVETEYGFHIIQLIEKRGDRVNTRHILLKPRVSDSELTQAINRLDTIRAEIVDSGRVTFEQAVPYISQDKDTRNNKGVMVNQETGTTYFEMSQLPQEIAKAVATMQPGDISKPFIMKDPKTTADVVAIVKLTSRLAPHKANMSDDYQLLKTMTEDARKQKVLDEWMAKKIDNTYVNIEPHWRNCQFKHKGWIKNN